MALAGGLRDRALIATKVRLEWLAFTPCNLRTTYEREAESSILPYAAQHHIAVL